jgi:hypothetical protein
MNVYPILNAKFPFWQRRAQVEEITKVLLEKILKGRSNINGSMSGRSPEYIPDQVEEHPKEPSHSIRLKS